MVADSTTVVQPILVHCLVLAGRAELFRLTNTTPSESKTCGIVAGSFHFTFKLSASRLQAWASS
eukprot:COSAG02_NODE_11009_length_1812_cov_2.632808_2_plen_63_part_01